METMEEELAGIARSGWQVEFRIIENGYGSVHHGCLIDDVMKGQLK